MNIYPLIGNFAKRSLGKVHFFKLCNAPAPTINQLLHARDLVEWERALLTELENADIAKGGGAPTELLQVSGLRVKLKNHPLLMVEYLSFPIISSSNCIKRT